MSQGVDSIALEHSKRAMPKGFSFNMGDAKYSCVCGRKKLPRKGEK